MTADYDVAVRDHMAELLHKDGELSALIEMRLESDHLLVVNVAVLPIFQGQGYGRALLAHAEEIARSLHLAEVRLYTNSRFIENLRLYKRLGHQVDHEEIVPDIGIAMHMSKSLPWFIPKIGSRGEFRSRQFRPWQLWPAKIARRLRSDVSGWKRTVRSRVTTGRSERSLVSLHRLQPMQL